MNLAQNLPNIRINTYKMLTTIHKWEEFSNSVKTTEKSSSNTSSLEAIHDGIHALIGGEEPIAGHMGELAFAGEYPPTQ